MKPVEALIIATFLSKNWPQFVKFCESRGFSLSYAKALLDQLEGS